MRKRGCGISRGAAVALLAAAVLAAGCASGPAPAPADAVSGVALVGEWGIQIKLMAHPFDGTLRFTREGRSLLGSFIDDHGNQSELQKLSVGDGKISWEMDAREGTLSAKGTIQGTIMSGKMKLKRSHDEATTGFGIGPGGMPTAGRRVGEPDSYTWTAIKREEGTPGEAPAPPPPPQ
jgi:hypothetical protein